MKAISIPRWGDPDVLEHVDIEEPRPGPGEICIRVVNAGVNFFDVMIRTGRRSGAQPPVVPGLEVAGVATEVGAGVRDVDAGDRVAAFVSGGYAQYAIAPQDLTWRLPERIGMDQAAAFPIVGVTAYDMLTKAARLDPGEIVLVWSAAGGVGTTAVRLSRLMGSSMVIGIVGSAKKRPAAELAGCDHVIVSSEEDVTGRVRQLTRGHGADVILNAIGGVVMEGDIDRLADYGRLVAYGTASGTPGLVASDALHGRSCSLIGYSSSVHRRSKPHELRTSGLKVLSLLEAERMEISIGAVFSLADASKAHELIESRYSVGKILLSVSDAAAQSA